MAEFCGRGNENEVLFHLSSPSLGHRAIDAINFRPKRWSCCVCASVTSSSHKSSVFHDIKCCPLPHVCLLSILSKKSYTGNYSLFKQAVTCNEIAIIAYMPTRQVSVPQILTQPLTLLLTNQSWTQAWLFNAVLIIRKYENTYEW